MNKYKLQISGYSVKYFLGTLIRNKIKLYYIAEEKNKLIIIIDQDDYKKLKKIKTSCKIKILNRYGFEKVRYLNYKYRYLILFFLLGLGLIIFLSNIVFSIDVVHTKKEIRNLVYNDLEKYGLRKYNFVLTYKQKEDLKNKILLKEKEKLEWLEIDRIGTKYIVNVEERKKNKTDNDTAPQNIIAKKDSMILEIKSSNGEVIKKKYDYVKAGDIIISGTIMNKDTEVSKIKAEGTVIGEVWYKVMVEVPINYHEEIPTGKKKKVLSLKMLNKSYSLEFKKYKNYSFNETKIFRNEILPIKLVIEEKSEQKVINKEYNINNIDKKALELAGSKFKKRDIILEKVLKKTINNSTIKVEIFLKVKEDITAKQKITDLSLREDINE